MPQWGAGPQPSALFLLGFLRIRVRGQRATRLQAPVLVAAPHSTFFDPIVLLPCDLPKVVSRAENLSVPVIGALLRFNQAILVSRHDPASRRRVVEEVRRRATSGGKWPQVLFFPEGTCSNKKALLKFKPGAFIAGVPVQPVLIRYPNSLDTTSWAWRALEYSKSSGSQPLSPAASWMWSSSLCIAPAQRRAGTPPSMPTMSRGSWHRPWAFQPLSASL